MCKSTVSPLHAAQGQASRSVSSETGIVRPSLHVKEISAALVCFTCVTVGDGIETFDVTSFFWMWVTEV